MRPGGDGGVFCVVARLWAVVFCLVGACFLVAPGLVPDLVSALAGRLGLGGRIQSGPGGLWWILALSLMATITVLAETCAREPYNLFAFRALVTAKLVSTAGFVGLATTGGAVWLLCALGDGFVAATLLLARRGMPHPGSGSATGPSRDGPAPTERPS
ncbi:MAG: hypothetical protein HY815_20970 [Candidatus Riflebacteria bacterium]|nr:hypothetical protein [Candidatus Riflebacteria bacterium]